MKKQNIKHLIYCLDCRAMTNHICGKCFLPNKFMKKEISKEIEIAERIVIDYANFSGRESENRGKFREEVLKHLLSYRNTILEEVQNLIVEEILVCHKENTPTSRLTSLAMKLKVLT